MSVYIEVVNGDRVKKQLQQEGHRYAHQRTLAGLKAGGKLLMRKSQEVVPYRTGRLEKSAYTAVRQSTMEVEVGYHAPYAWYVHEMPARYIQMAGRTNKYLERPSRQYRREILQEVLRVARMR